MPQDRKGGVGGTVDAFNFIRRVGFPTTSRVISIFAGIALLSASISLLPSDESLAQTLVFVGAILVGLAVSLPIRFLSTDAMSSLAAWRKLSAALTTPILVTSSFLALGYFVSPATPLQTLLPKILVLLVTCSIVSASGVSFIIHRVEVSGRSEIGSSPMGLFRSFLHHWLRKTPSALEERLLTLSTEGSIETKILS